MTGMELAGMVCLAALGLVGLVLLVWAVVEEYHDTRVERRRAAQHTRRLAIQAEQVRIHQDAQAVSRRLQQQAWAVRRQMVEQVIGRQSHRPHQWLHATHPANHTSGSGHTPGGGSRG